MDEFRYNTIKTSGSIKKLVIFLHGYTSEAADIMPQAKIIAEHLKNALIIVPEADMISERKPDKKQWYALVDIDPDRRRREPKTTTAEIIEIYNKAGLRISDVAKRVNRLISKIQKEYGISNKNTFLLGFSQGAMLAIYAGLTRRYNLGGIFPFAGIICGKDLLEAEQLSHPKVYLFHGTEDLSVQYKTLEFTKEWLQQHDIYWEAIEYDGIDHKLIAEEMIDAAKIINRSS